MTLDADGKVTISADGKAVATGKVPGPLRRRPTDALSVGRDSNAPVGEYDMPFPFDGKLGEVRLELTGKPYRPAPHRHAAAPGSVADWIYDMKPSSLTLALLACCLCGGCHGTTQDPQEAAATGQAAAYVADPLDDGLHCPYGHVTIPHVPIHGFPIRPDPERE